MRKDATHLIINQTLSIDFIWCYKLLNYMSNPIIYIKPIIIIHEDLTEEYGSEVTLEFDIDTVTFNYDSDGKEMDEMYDTKELGKDAVIHKELEMFS